MATGSRAAFEQRVRQGVEGVGGINTYQVRPYTIVEVYAEIDGLVYRGVGMAKLSKRDIWNSLTGHEVAYGRAVKDIRKQYNRK